MKLLKMLGLVITAAVVAITFIGATSASATNSTAICTEASAPLACPSGKLATTLHLVATNPLWHTSLVNIVCESSIVKRTVAQHAI